MQATYGLAVLSRSRTRLIGCSIAIALALSALMLALASTARAAEPPHKTYLGLGNSLAFGYSQEIFNENYPTEDPKAFEHAVGSNQPNGYVLDYFLKHLKPNQTSASTWNKPINDGCPGETTDSFIGNGHTGKQLEMTIPGTHGEAPCAYKYVNKFKLHHEYKGPEPIERPSGQSQLENTLEVIAHENTGKHLTEHPVVLISLDSGANDLLHAVAKCEAEVKTEFETEGKSKYGATPTEAVKVCLEAHAGQIFTHILTNIAGILYTIRNGSQFCLPDCDEDPNDHGVNYTGKIIFQGYYDPYGAVFTPGVELLPGSNVLQLILNAKAKKTVEAFGACYANPQSSPANVKHAFNPAYATPSEPLEEPPRLQAWTNMANFTTAKNGNKAKNGPDIHPTPLGYEILADQFEEECP